MGGIVVADDMNFLVRRSAPRNESQELQLFLMAVLIHAATDDAAIGYIHRGKKRGDTVALIVMSHGPAPPLLEWQPRLGAIQGLNLTLFIARKHEGVLGRRQVKPDDIIELFFKLPVIGELETLDPMRFQTMRRPDPPHGRGADSHGPGHGFSAPVRGPRRLSPHGHFHQERSPGSRDRLDPARSRLVFEDARQALPGVALPPTPHLAWVLFQASGDLLVLHTLSGKQDHRGTFSHSYRTAPSLAQPL